MVIKTTNYLFISVPTFSFSVFLENANQDIFPRQLSGGHTHLYTEESLNYLAKKNKLKIEFMGRGSSWLDTGNVDSLYETSQFISNIEKRQGLKIACLEEIALNNKWISKDIIKKQIIFYGNCAYSKYLKKIIQQH